MFKYPYVLFLNVLLPVYEIFGDRKPSQLAELVRRAEDSHYQQAKQKTTVRETSSMSTKMWLEETKRCVGNRRRTEGRRVCKGPASQRNKLHSGVDGTIGSRRLSRTAFDRRPRGARHCTLWPFTRAIERPSYVFVSLYSSTECRSARSRLRRSR